MSETANNEVEVIDLTGLSDSSESEEHNETDDDDEAERQSDSGSESVSEIEIPLNPETRAQLQSAIDTVSETRLRHLLRLLVESNQELEEALTRELVTVRRGTQQVVPRWETCANCSEEFDINTLREGSECVFHPGDLEASEDSFIDWDPDCHGPVDTLENRKKFPENFAWTCCQENGRSTGCVQDKHKSLVSRKRRRLNE